MDKQMTNSVSTADIYLEELHARVAKYYSYGEAEPTVKKDLKLEIKGFLDAGIKTGLVSIEQTKEIINTEHQKAFGMSVEERRLKKRIAQADDPIEWSTYETPTYQRTISRKSARAGSNQKLSSSTHIEKPVQ